VSLPAALYRDAALAEAWRLSSLVDRNPLSATRGSFSRTHWAWKFDDFPYPRMQEGVYGLVRLFELRQPGSAFFESPDVACWIAWGFEYWASRQHRNGAFDEAYPYEQCLAATAFTGFYLGHAYVRHRDRLAQALRLRIERALRRAADWLCRNDETHAVLSNHLAAAVASLEIAGRIAGNEQYSKRARFFLDRILRHQSPDGWMKEYDGADVGYGAQGFFYLATYWKMTGCPDTLEALRRFAQFLWYFIHPDGTIGGEYTSRNTEFYYPAGFEILASECAASAAIAAAMRQSLAERRACGIWAMDTFNFMPMLNNLWFAMDAAREVSVPEPLPCERASFEKYFPECGLWVINDATHYSVIGLSKGGTVSMFDKTSRRLAARHSGLIAEGGRRRFTSQDYTLSPALEWSSDGRTVSLAVPWKNMDGLVFTPWLFVCFRLFNLTAGRIPAASRWLKDVLVRVLIRRKGRPAITHRRTIRICAQGIDIDDDIQLPSNVRRIVLLSQFTAVHMGSSLYADIRALEGSTASAVFECDGRLKLRGSLGLSGATWQTRVP
jgi:hypothetical protein